MRALLFIVAALLCACTSAQPFKLDAVTSLTQPDPAEVSFKGLEFLADTISGQVKPRVNIIYLHGIGWTEDPGADALGQEFLDGIARAYDIESQVSAAGKCLDDASGPERPNDDLLYISSPITKDGGGIRFETAIPGTYLELDRLACIDRHALDVSDTLDVIVYRIFWDDTFWNGLQFAHLGQDDTRGASAAFANLRRRFNRDLKDELVNYGISDAVMYLGPAGKTIRSAVRGAICAAALDAGGYSFARQGLNVSYATTCDLAQNTSIERNRFAFVSESLGSKITYDLLRNALTDGADGPLDDLTRGSEIYMLANQMPLLSLSDISEDTSLTRAAPVLSDGERPTIIAVSEVNDFLTYEIVPFLKQLWSRTTHQDTRDFEDVSLRAEIARRIGFDVIDLRVLYADPSIPFVGSLVDPLQAHKEHANEPEIIRLILCGMADGTVREAGCLAENRADDT